MTPTTPSQLPRRITSAEQLSDWLSINNATPEDLFRDRPVTGMRRAHGVFDVTPNGAQVLNLKEAFTGQVVRWVSAADLVQWARPAKVAEEIPFPGPFQWITDAFSEVLATGQKAIPRTWTTETFAMNFGELPALIGDALPGAAVFLRAARTGVHGVGRVTVSGVGSVGTVRASFDLTFAHGVRQVEYVGGVLGELPGSTMNRAIVMQARYTTAAGKERFGPVGVEMGIYRPHTLMKREPTPIV